MIEIKINPESIERHRASVKAFETMKIGEYRMPVVIDRGMPPYALSIGAMSTVFREYYETCQRNERALLSAVQLTGIPAHEIRAMAACSPLPFEVFCMGLIYDQTQTDHSKAPTDQRP